MREKTMAEIKKSPNDKSKDSQDRIYATGLKQAVSASTTFEHEREYLADELKTRGLGLFEVVKKQDVAELSDILAIEEALATRLHHHCSVEYSKILSTGERYCVAPTVNYVKWKKGKPNSPTIPTSPTNQLDLSQIESPKQPTKSKMSPRPQSPVHERTVQKLEDVANDRAKKASPKRLGLETPISPLKLSGENDKALVAPEPVTFSPNNRLPSPTIDDVLESEAKSNNGSPGPPSLFTDASILKRKEKRKSVIEAEIQEALEKAQEDKKKRELMMQKALKGPKISPIRPKSASATVPASPRFATDRVITRYKERRKSTVELATKAAVQKVKEERRKREERKERALKGSVPKQSRSPRLRPSSASPILSTPSPAKAKAPFISKSSERAKQRKIFDDHLRKKMLEQEEKERQLKLEEEKRAAEEIKEFRKTLKFKARPMPKFFSSKKESKDDSSPKSHNISSTEKTFTVKTKFVTT